MAGQPPRHWVRVCDPVHRVLNTSVPGSTGPSCFFFCFEQGHEPQDMDPRTCEMADGPVTSLRWSRVNGAQHTCDEARNQLLHQRGRPVLIQHARGCPHYRAPRVATQEPNTYCATCSDATACLCMYGPDRFFTLAAWDSTVLNGLSGGTRSAQSAEHWPFRPACIRGQTARNHGEEQCGTERTLDQRRRCVPRVCEVLLSWTAEDPQGAVANRRLDGWQAHMRSSDNTAARSVQPSDAAPVGAASYSGWANNR